jgi:hypothetical protein
MSLRRLEMIVEETRSKSVLQLSEIGRKAAEIHRLKAEIGKLGKPVAPSVPSRIRMALVRAGMAQSDAA